jgi:hypothetical protein
VVGSGRRIRNNFLPALDHLSPRLDVVGLWSPTRAHAEAAAAPWDIEVAASIEAVLPAVDTVIVSVATPAVRTVLETLAPAARRLILVVDTPIFGDPRHLPAVALLRRFAKVLVAEDYARYPQWDLVRAAVAGGLVGEPEQVELDHSGYRYHGLALIRSIFGYPFARRLRRRTVDGALHMEFGFGAGRSGRIVEPYDQRCGTTVVRGRTGIIVAGDHPDFPPPGTAPLGTAPSRTAPSRTAPPGSDLPVHRLETVGPDAAPLGFSLAGQRSALPALPSLLAAEVPDPSVFNALKTCGLLAVLSDLWNPGPPRYGYRDALYDHLATAWLRAAPGALDPAAHVDRNFVDLLEVAARLRPPRHGAVGARMAS